MFGLNLANPYPGSVTPSKESMAAETGEKTSWLNEPRFLLDSGSAVRALKSCTAERNLRSGGCVHANVLKSGLNSIVFVSNSLLYMYSKCGRQDDAATLFEEMPERTVVSWTTLLAGCFQERSFREGISVFVQMLEAALLNGHTLAVLLRGCAQEGNLKMVRVVHCYSMKLGLVSENFLHNCLLNAYAKSGALDSAVRLLERFANRDVVAWTSVISGFVACGLPMEALDFLFLMQQEDGVMPNEVTILSILQACSLIKDRRLFQWIHALLMKSQWYGNALVMNSLVEMYSVNGHFIEGIKIACTEGNYHLSPETMANLVHGCAHSGCLKLGKQIHGNLLKQNFVLSTIIQNSLIYMYGENQELESAFQLYRTMESKDIVSWNTMITLLAKNDRPDKALQLVSEIHSKAAENGVFPDFITMLSSIQACADLSLHLGQAIHGYITRAGMVGDVFVQNALIDMYGKSGRLDLALQVFEEMPERDLGSWNSMISAYGVNGDGGSAVHAFIQLCTQSIFLPNAITFANVLFACAHAGLVNDGLEIFDSMERKHGVKPRMEHYTAVVDLLARAGRLNDAEGFIRRKPASAGATVWTALLGGCGLFGNVEIAERAAEKLGVLEKESMVWRVVLANVYAMAGRWEEAAKVRAEMRGWKESGWSSVELRGEMCRFMVADTAHQDSNQIYGVLNRLHQHMRDDNVSQFEIY